MSKKPPKCVIPGCDDPVSPESESGQLCRKHVEAARRQTKLFKWREAGALVIEDENGMIWGDTDA